MRLTIDVSSKSEIGDQFNRAHHRINAHLTRHYKITQDEEIGNKSHQSTELTFSRQFALLETVRLVLEGCNGPDSDDEDGVCYQPQPSSSGGHTSSDWEVSHLPANRLQAIKKQEMIGGPCAHCGTNDSPQWRRPLTKKVVLCNACGIYYSRHHSLPKKKKAIVASGEPMENDDVDSLTEDRELQTKARQGSTRPSTSCSGAESQSIDDKGQSNGRVLPKAGSNLRKSSIVDKRKTSDGSAEEGHFDEKRLAMRAAAAAAAASSALTPLLPLGIGHFPLFAATQSLPASLQLPFNSELLELSSLPLPKPVNNLSEASEMISQLATKGTSYP